ncbi:alpha-glucosidase C-terminal domain-containing protein [Mucilaginibacter sp. ZT4R22]|uniref:Alpha-glucosidase C-terminal domain-containing protein n=1 Tax=Mucilaginibacter pankratovii TaxID=2772110 RepID=A0ABR7WUU9_9SPHI|nr:alpha-amylase family glycosyl hydrolase [Mucilaginibacter pankratovii]MBD1366086.1 alpha-glucosidase C-terminal domain-containing protein [Mucilaginibacter pankratovii]
MKRNLLILFCLVALLCIQNPALFAQTNLATPAQYGKPFKNVPDRRDVSIYQVNMRTFGKNGDFKGVTERLDSIKALGVNVIYLMPIYPVGILKAVNSPYCIRDYTAINKEFGTLDDLRQLVDGAHSRNLAVILDWVANHTAYDHVWTKNKSWYLQDSTGNIISPPNMGWRDVAQLNFKNPDMRRAMMSAMKYWILAANVDGFRCDYSDGPPFDFWKQALDTLKNIPNHTLLLLSEGGRKDHYKAGFDYNFGFNFFGNLKAVFERNRSVLSIDSLNTADYKDTEEGQQMVRYTTNHDVNGSDGTPLELFGGKKGSMAAFVVIACMKSVPMIYNGQEVGTPYRLLFPFTAKKIDWTLNPDVTAEYKKIIGFRNSSKAIRRGKLTSYSSADVCAFTKENGKEKVFVLSNLRNKTVSYTIPADLLKSKWKNAFTEIKMTINANITLEPYSYLILKN